MKQSTLKRAKCKSVLLLLRSNTSLYPTTWCSALDILSWSCSPKLCYTYRVCSTPIPIQLSNKTDYKSRVFDFFFSRHERGATMWIWGFSHNQMSSKSSAIRLKISANSHLHSEKSYWTLSTLAKDELLTTLSYVIYFVRFIQPIRGKKKKMKRWTAKDFAKEEVRAG